jgi:hypothetical protein
MIRSVVHHEDSCPAPLRIFGIEMSTQLGQEKSVCVLVGNANVDCVEQLTSAAERSNHIETTDFASGGHLVLLVFLHPSVLAMVCKPYD